MKRIHWSSAAVLSVVAATAHAGQTWTFDITTTGQNVNWTSPTSVDPSASNYAVKYTITKVEVDVTWIGIPFNDIDVTNQVPPELQSAAFNVAGPAPISALNTPVVVPPPPTAPAFSATLSFGLNAGGFGFASATNVVLGTLQVNLGGIFGTQTVTLKSVRLVGNLTMHNAFYDLGFALPGTNGIPVLSGEGQLAANTPITLTLSNAAPLSTALFVAGVSQLNAPFFGGTMVPSLNVLFFLPTDSLGGIVLPATWPAGVPAGVSIYMQYWVLNGSSTGVNGASNALRALAQ